MTGVRGELLWAIDHSGPLRAIIVCSYTVPEIASALPRKNGARVTRVPQTPRNPSLGWRDAWEQKVLLAGARLSARPRHRPDVGHGVRRGELQEAAVGPPPQGLRPFR